MGYHHRAKPSKWCNIIMAGKNRCLRQVSSWPADLAQRVPIIMAEVLVVDELSMDLHLGQCHNTIKAEWAAMAKGKLWHHLHKTCTIIIFLMWWDSNNRLIVIAKSMHQVVDQLNSLITLDQPCLQLLAVKNRKIMANQKTIVTYKRPWTETTMVAMSLIDEPN